jgi:hypothetical protein
LQNNYLRTGAFLYTPYSFLLISNKLWMEGRVGENKRWQSRRGWSRGGGVGGGEWKGGGEQCGNVITISLYDTVGNVFDAGRYITGASGRGLGRGNWVFWALWNGIEPNGECNLRPKKLPSPDFRKNVVIFFWSKIQLSYPQASIKDVQFTGKAFNPQIWKSSTSKHDISFCLPGSGSGSTDLIESGSNPDPQHRYPLTMVTQCTQN